MFEFQSLFSLRSCLGGLLLIGLGCGGRGSPPASTTAPPVPANAIWVSSWADAPSLATGGVGSELTVRAIVKPTVGSRGIVRLHFSNFFGTAPITLGAVRVGKQTAGAGVSADTPVSFAGATSIIRPAGGTVLSENVSLGFSYGDTLSITEYLSGSWTNATAHAQGGDAVTNYATLPHSGDQTGDTAGTNFVQTTPYTFLLDRVDVYGNYKETIAAFGSSTTDGLHSGLDQHMSYPEQLAAALHAAGHDDIAIANVGISGTTVLGTQATAGLNRFSRDVVSLPGVTAVIDYLGANDLRYSCVKAAALLAGKQNLIAQAHAAGLKIYEATTAPSTFCNAQSPGSFGTRLPEGSGEEAERFLLNAWQVSTTASVVDGVSVEPPASDATIDFSRALADPDNLSYMLPALDSGDAIHPNAKGYGEMAKAVPLNLF